MADSYNFRNEDLCVCVIALFGTRFVLLCCSSDLLRAELHAGQGPLKLDFVLRFWDFFLMMKQLVSGVCYGDCL